LIRRVRFSLVAKPNDDMNGLNSRALKKGSRRLEGSVFRARDGGGDCGEGEGGGGGGVVGGG
jgi:hypothetical protein